MDHRGIATLRGYGSPLANVYGQAWPPPGLHVNTRQGVPNNRKRKETKLDQVVPADHDGSESDRSRGVVSPGRCDDVPCDSYRYKCGIKWDLSQGATPGDGKSTLSQAEYKKFNQQVRDVNLYNSNNYTPFRGVGYKKYFNPQASQDCNAVYRSQLASSLKAFKSKAWTALDTTPVDEPVYFRCRSFRGPTNDTGKTNDASKQQIGSRCSTPGVSSNQRVRSSKLQRPRSVPASALYRSSTPAEVTESEVGPYDTLTPDILYELSNCYAKDTWFGERPYSALSVTSGLDKSAKDSDLSSTSGLGSDKDSDKDEDEDVEDETKVLAKDSDLSDDEDIPEPSVDKERSAPDLFLRPEKLDSMYVPEGRKGMIKYDFDAENVDIPEYEFAYILPEELQSLDVRAASATDRNWRQLTKNRPKEPSEMQFIDRLIEIERLKTQTEEWESKRDARLRHLRRNRLTLSRISSATSRVQSAKSRDRDRRCCKGCLQPACVGDCPDRGLLADDTTQNGGERPETPYDFHRRSNRADSEQTKPQRKPRPKSCNQCQRRHNAKLINANNVVLGRPRSSYATYSRGQGSHPPKDMRPETPVTHHELDRSFERLGIESYKAHADTGDDHNHSNSNSAEPRLYRGRAATIPGKSYFSNRRYSLTTSNIQSRINSFRKKRPKSSKRHKPKT